MSCLAVAPKHAMPELPSRSFQRRLQEFVAERDAKDVAQRTRYTVGRIYQLCRGEKPSREFVERLVEAYGLPREEWLTLAGIGLQSSPDPEEALLARAAQRGAEEALRQAGFVPGSFTERMTIGPQPEPEPNGKEIWFDGLISLKQRYGRPIPVDMELGDNPTPEEARRHLADLEKQAKDGTLWG